MDDDPIFKALADPSRRLLLDRLHGRDGQTLTELHGHLPAMTRFGVMKHLRALEEAGLVASRKVGRERFHYLNPVPIQGLYDRWVSKYARPWARALAGLRDALEEDRVSENGATPPAHVYRIYIRTTPEELWRALTDGAITPRYVYGTAVESTWEPGAPYRYATPDGNTMVQGEVLAAEPPRRLVISWQSLWDPTPSAVSRVTWEIEPAGAACKLTVIHEGLTEEEAGGFADAWALILSGLKTVLETGQPLPVGA